MRPWDNAGTAALRQATQTGFMRGVLPHNNGLWPGHVLHLLLPPPTRFAVGVSELDLPGQPLVTIMDKMDKGSNFFVCDVIPADFLALYNLSGSSWTCQLVAYRSMGAWMQSSA